MDFGNQHLNMNCRASQIVIQQNFYKKEKKISPTSLHMERTKHVQKWQGK